MGENTTSARSLPSSSITSYSASDSSINGLSLSVSPLTSFQTPEIEAEEYQAIDSYQADGPGQLSFEAGETIHVLDKLEDGRSNGQHIHSSITLLFLYLMTNSAILLSSSGLLRKGTVWW